MSISCDVLGVSASEHFAWQRRRADDRLGPAGCHGDEALLAKGIRVGKERVRRLMQQHGIKAKTNASLW